MSCGNKAIWFDKNHPDVTFLDIRKEVNPTYVCDTRQMNPAVGEGYDLIVFDPPHVNFGKNSNFSKCYGHHTTEQIRDLVSRSSQEAARVSTENALMAFKWNDHDQKLENILALMPDWEPLFGNKIKAGNNYHSQTYWVMLRRKPPGQGEGEGKT